MPEVEVTRSYIGAEGDVRTGAVVEVSSARAHYLTSRRLGVLLGEADGPSEPVQQEKMEAPPLNKSEPDTIKNKADEAFRKFDRDGDGLPGGSLPKAPAADAAPAQAEPKRKGRPPKVRTPAQGA